MTSWAISSERSGMMHDPCSPICIECLAQGRCPTSAYPQVPITGEYDDGTTRFRPEAGGHPAPLQEVEEGSL